MRKSIFFVLYEPLHPKMEKVITNPSTTITVSFLPLFSSLDHVNDEISSVNP
jgi:hypothetical protein